MSPHERSVMLAEGLGWDVSTQIVRHGTVAFQGGGLPQFAGPTAQKGVTTAAVSFASGVQVPAMINSEVTPGFDLFNAIVTEYEESWVPLR